MRCSLLFALLTLLAAAAGAQQSNDLSTLGSALTGRPLVLDGNLIMESVGLQDVIRDHEDPAQPTMLGWLDHGFSGFYGDRVHDGGLVVALQADLPWGFEVIDVGDPTSPAVVHSSTGTQWISCWLRDNVLVLSQSDYAVVYGLQDPTTPVFLSAMSMSDHQGRRWFCHLDGILYGIDRGPNLRGFDLTEPSEPVDLGTTGLATTRIEALVAGDGVLYALTAEIGANTSFSLQTLRPTEGMNFDVTSTLPLADVAHPGAVSLCRRDDLLLVSPGDGTVRSLDVSTPSLPEPGFVVDHGGDHLAMSQDQIFALSADTLHIYHRPATGAPLEVAARRAVIPTYRTVMGNGSVVLAQRDDAPRLLVPVDISNPEVPQPSAPIDLGFGEGLSYGNGLLIATESSHRFDLWDVSSPLAPVLLSTVDNPDLWFGRAFIDGDRVAFFSVADGGIALYDLSDPLAPKQATAIHTSYPRAYHNGLLLSGVGSPLRLFTAHDPYRPKLASRIQLNGNPLAATLGPGLMLASVERLPGEVTLHLFDTTQPSAPVERGSVPLPGRATNVVVHGNRAYAQGYHTTWVVDITDPTAPTVDGEFLTWGQAGRGLAFHDNLTVNSGWLVCLHDAGFVITDTPLPPAPAAHLHPAYPNPFNPSTTLSFDVPRNGRYELTIHDARGRLVTTLVDDNLSAGHHQRSWTGRDHTGKPAASGVYLVRLHGPETESYRTITLVK